MVDDSGAAAILPPGDENPDTVYIAVGKSIHRWESLEQALARLYLKFSSVPDSPENYLSYGQANGTFLARMTALANAAEAHFIKHPDQNKEGTFQEILKRALALSIERHRIAHGHITMWGAIKTPTVPAMSTVTVNMKVLYRWAPPWYGVRKLRTNPVGFNGQALEMISRHFEHLHNQALAFTESL